MINIAIASNKILIRV